MAKRIKVRVPEKKSYEIIINHDFSTLADELSACSLKGRKACIITDSNVLPLYADQVKAEVEKCCQVFTYTFPAGEENKTLEQIQNMYEFLIASHFDRKDFLIALGGGVTGDMTGFAAATYLRGIDFVQIPTTLLAQVDSSIGGKTGVDFKQYKNMVGAFHMPRLVYMNLSVLKTLDSRQFSSGMGEILKHGLIKNAAYYEWLITSFSEINDKEPEALEKMIYESCIIKKQVVENDPAEKGERALLNFGHTLGHAIEKAENFKLAHGECVALGCICAAFISWKRELISMEDYYEIRDMFVPFGLPISIDLKIPSKIVEDTKSDKKMEAGKIKFILLNKIGQAFIDTTVTEEEMLLALEEINYNGEKE